SKRRPAGGIRGVAGPWIARRTLLARRAARRLGDLKTAEPTPRSEGNRAPAAHPVHHGASNPKRRPPIERFLPALVERPRRIEQPVPTEGPEVVQRDAPGPYAPRDGRCVHLDECEPVAHAREYFGTVDPSGGRRRPARGLGP